VLQTTQLLTGSGLRIGGAVIVLPRMPSQPRRKNCTFNAGILMEILSKPVRNLIVFRWWIGRN
jgi:hypothetical protein